MSDTNGKTDAVQDEKIKNLEEDVAEIKEDIKPLKEHVVECTTIKREALRQEKNSRWLIMAAIAVATLILGVMEYAN